MNKLILETINELDEAILNGEIEKNSAEICKRLLISGEFQSAYDLLDKTIIAISEIMFDTLSPEEKVIVKKAGDRYNPDLETDIDQILVEGMLWANRLDDLTLSLYEKVSLPSTQQLGNIEIIAKIMTRIGYLLTLSQQKN